MTKAKPKKLLTAAVGVATVSYVVSCGGKLDDSPTSGNLIAPPEASTGNDASTNEASTLGVNPGSTISGNLMPPPSVTTVPNSSVISGNLVAPPDWTTTPVETSEPPPPVDTGIISGNLLPPPTDLPTSLPPETIDAPTMDGGAAFDAASDSGLVEGGLEPNPVDAGLVISGNLLPPPSLDAELPEEP